MLALEQDIQEGFTVEDIYNLPEGRRAELIDGQMYDMAAPSLRHQEIAGRLYRKIGEYIDSNGGSCRVVIAPFAVFLNDDDRTYVEPDVTVVCDPKKLHEDGCHGAPDWVVEVVSPGSERMDYLVKLLKYRSAGVREYWIVDADTSVVNVYNFEHDDRVHAYRFDTAVPAGIYEDFAITLEELGL